MKKYVIEGECVPKARAKYNRYGGSYGKAFERQVKYENHVKGSLIEQNAKPLKNAVRMRIDIYKGYLKSWTKKQLKQAKNGELQPVKRPDVDNYTKSILDGANGLLYKDDSQIVSLLTNKHYDETPRVEVFIEEV